MTLQLPFFLDASSNKYVTFEIIALIGKKSPKPNRKLKKKLYIQFIKKVSKFDKKTRKKKLRGLN